MAEDESCRGRLAAFGYELRCRATKERWPLLTAPVVTMSPVVGTIATSKP
jgi:hypothetical protein